MKERFKAILAVFLIVIKEGKTLLYLRQNTGYSDGMYGLISGHVEMNETIFEAMIREAKEEALMELKRSNLDLVSVMYRKSDLTLDNRVDFFFKLKDWDGEIQNNEPEKCKELKFFEINKMPKNTIGYIQKAIANSLNGTFFDEYGFF